MALDAAFSRGAQSRGRLFEMQEDYDRAKKLYGQAIKLR